MHQTDSSFVIKTEDQRTAFLAVKREMADRSYHWIEKGWMKGLRDLYAVLEHWNYQPTIDDNTGDIIDVQFNAEKLGQEIELFKIIAPFVVPGSFIEMRGEDSSIWRWVFDGITCKEIEPTITWE